MGVQPKSVPLLLGGMPEPKKLRENECLFRGRLTIEKSDQWWEYSPTQSSMDAAVRDACDVYEKVGRYEFDRMALPASPLQTLSPEEFRKGAYCLGRFGITSVLMAWALAHMRKAAGESEAARAFAQIALDEIGDGRYGSARKDELRDLLASV